MHKPGLQIGAARDLPCLVCSQSEVILREHLGHLCTLGQKPGQNTHMLRCTCVCEEHAELVALLGPEEQCSQAAP